jgi:hypothetical protein
MDLKLDSGLHLLPWSMDIVSSIDKRKIDPFVPLSHATVKDLYSLNGKGCNVFFQ